MAVSGALDLLRAASLVRPGESTVEPEYRFKHSLIQETAYASLLRERRQELHRQVAEAILRLNPEAATYQPAVLAFHYYRGGDDEQAFPFAIRAGDLARRNYAHQEAIANYDVALEVAERLSPEAVAPLIRSAFVGKGTALEVSGRHDEARAVYQAMESFARRTNDLGLEAEALNRMATTAVISSAPESAVAAMLTRAEALAREADDPLALARTLWNQGLRLRFRDPLRAETYFQRALEITRRPACLLQANGDEFRELEAFVLIDLMASAMTSGRRHAALRTGAQALAAFRRLDNKAMVADALAGLALLHHEGGDFDTALAFSDEGMAISTAIDNPWGVAYNGLARLSILADRGEWTEALALGDRLLEAAKRVPFVGVRGSLCGVVSHIWLDLGDYARALDYAQQMLAIVEGASEAGLWKIWTHGVLGRVLLAQGDVSAAAALVETYRHLPEGVIPSFQDFYAAGPTILAVDLALGEVERGLRFAGELLARLEADTTNRYVAEVLLCRARLHNAAGDAVDPEVDLRRAADLLERMRARARLFPVYRELAAALQRQGRATDAERARSLASDAVRQIADGLIDPVLRRSFLARQEVAAWTGAVDAA